MAENSSISWTHHTFNPWRGCVKVSPGCKHCYAEQLVTKRQGLPLWGLTAERRVAAESTWKEPLRWNRKAREAGVRHRVFCASLADVFEPRLDLFGPRMRLARLIEQTPHLDWLLLTKRPQCMIRFGREQMWGEGPWPENVWAGTTVENQEMAEERIPNLLNVPAKVRFLSCEPLLEPVDLAPWLHGISWVIMGGESGPSARLFDLGWARARLGQCKTAGVPFFFKQTGSNAIDGPVELSTRYKTAHKAGADPAEWPADLRIQEFPR